ncbi:MAG TPA: hypothetical protein VLV16_08805 [Gemmatimonadales bacterium]|nr:hypothetical protein [Gemmatimonadales bacterium]
MRTRNAHSLVLLLVACTPISTRPDFHPFPQAETVLLVTRPQSVVPYLQTLLAAESLGVRRANARDGYLEAHWYDAGTHQSTRSDDGVTDLPNTVKIRCWADPYVPGETMVTVEVVYRPRYDPSRLERELEVPVPADHAGAKLADRLVAKLKEKFGTP